MSVEERTVEAGTDWEKLTRRMELLLRLRSFPVAFQLLASREALGRIPYLRRAPHKSTLCQLITKVRNSDWTVGPDLDDFIGPMCPSVIGLTDIPEAMKDGTFRSIVWTRNRDEGRRYEASVPRLPPGRYEAVAMAPLVYRPFEPQIVLLYANPAQMILLINALQFEDYEVMQFSCVGETSCADAIARCYLTGKPSLTLPCYGERRYGHAQDDELVMALPAGVLPKALRGLEALYRRGIRYPISYAGADLDVTGAFPMSYAGVGQLEAVRGNDGRLLLGVTGGIASGKSTVARMLEEKGAPIIDFDVLAREVVEPDRPAWKQIVAYFGEQVLTEDRTLDRKKLSGIVFADLEKKKKLESFTHPQIGLLFLERLGEITAKDPDAIVQVVVPLLIEVNMQYLFHKILVVHIPPDVQIRRLMERDGISRQEAQTIASSQIPIDEKVGYADFVIRNHASLAETRAQVDRLWEDLKRLQEERKAGP